MVTEGFARSGASTFGAIADPTRRAILDLLRTQERSAGELAAHFPLSRPAISRHVRVLRRAGLVRERRAAQLRYYALDAARLADIDAWLAPYRLFWAARLQRLRQVVEAEHGTRRK
jgi:DNA-binding transcriptional ArsR family regulator